MAEVNKWMIDPNDAVMLLVDLHHGLGPRRAERAADPRDPNVEETNSEWPEIPTKTLRRNPRPSVRPD
jgi:hypothetical protein